MRRTGLLVCLGAMWCAGGLRPAAAQILPTRVMVRVTAHDAKIIGSGVGGARVTVIATETGDTLAAGIQEGGTGNTQAIMVSPRVRGTPVFDTPGSAGFLAAIHVVEPTLVEIVAEGPLGTAHAMQRASKTMWIIPGHDVLGDGIILELLGFTVVLTLPVQEATVTPHETFEIRATVTMLCGCPTEPGGLWNADEIDVIARLHLDGTAIQDIPLAYAGETSTYHATASVPMSGRLTIEVIATDDRKGNFGIARRHFSVRSSMY